MAVIKISVSSVYICIQNSLLSDGLTLVDDDRHRHPASHSCQSLDTDEQRKMERKLAAQEKVAKTFTSQPTKKRKVITSVPVRSKNGGMVELMKIKSQAKGSPSVPAASRIYIYVQGPKESKVDSQSVYFDKVSIGLLICVYVSNPQCCCVHVEKLGGESTRFDSGYM